VSRVSQKQVAYRAKVRRWEFELMTSTIMEVMPKKNIGKLRVLEFGCGPGTGAEYLCQFGNVTLTDIRRNSSLVLPLGVEFKIEDIHQTDFSDNEFDIIVSSHVLPYLDMPRACQEMKRIGKENAYYAFSVPTTTWLLLSIPAMVFKKFENVYNRIRGGPTRSNKTADSSFGCRTVSTRNSRLLEKGWLHRFVLGALCYPCFLDAFKGLRVKNWRNILLSNGFTIVKEIPLLTYGDSDVPIITPIRFPARLGVASSYLFVCRKMYDSK